MTSKVIRYKMTEKTKNSVENGSVDPIEMEKFRAMANEWWDPEGKFKPLHKINPLRVEYIRNNVSQHFNLDKNSLLPFSGLKVLDIGCGGGLLCEPMARLGATVTGIDVLSENIEIAKIHSEETSLSITYRKASIEELVSENKEFDIILNMEVVEHVVNIEDFLANCANTVSQNGLLFFSTLNRTPKSFLLAIIGAEYILRWLPRGTHDWKKFIKPSEITNILLKAEIEVRDLTGVTFNPLNGLWSANTSDLEVNYMGYGKKFNT